eukprot:TRINITY_DN21083_c0_g1_i1.p1 TRINITY_DN21083_c0_g1~~TRINITY_DN21083_c0_g1_i1.p1  ORF type:complete len:295 (+),score=33.24 TRINITY_DN21083_c0_g1_i1:37-885(+)
MERCTAIFDYDGQGEGELSFKAGDIILVISKGRDSGWWEGTIDGRSGMFPNCFVTMMESLRGYGNTAVALYDYCNDQESCEMKFKRGDIIEIQKISTECPGWWWAVKRGEADAKMTPSNYFTCNVVTTLFPFAARSPQEISFKKNEVIIIKRRWNDGWWEGKIGSRQGIFPANYTVLNYCTTSPPVFCNKDLEILRVGATECQTCAINHEITSTMLRSLEDWVRAGEPPSSLDLFEHIPLVPSGGPGSLLSESDLELSARQGAPLASGLSSDIAVQNPFGYT